METIVKAVGALSAAQVDDVLRAAIASPSLHNSQPWHFQCTDETIRLYADHSRRLPAADPDGRELLLACGAALFNLRVAVRANDVYPEVRLFPAQGHANLIAEVRVNNRRAATPADRALAESIPHRHTNRRPFHPAEVVEHIRRDLRRAAEAERAWLAVVETTQLTVLRDLIHRAHQVQLADPAFVAEWQHWTGRDRTATEGVPAYSSGPMPESQDEWVLRDFSGGTARSRVPGKDFESAPLLVVLGSFHDQASAHVSTGQALQRVLLTATTFKLSASFLSQVTEVPDTRKKLRSLVGGGVWPQIVLRIGYGLPTAATPRRPLADFLIGGHRAVGIDALADGRTDRP